MSLRGPLRVGVGGPVGSGKTALVERLCKKMRETYDIAVVTNDIYTKEDAEFLTRAGALAPERIVGVETGGCPHTAIREDASINLAAVSDIVRKWPDLEVVFVESGGDNLAATFSPELADMLRYQPNAGLPSHRAAGAAWMAKSGLDAQGERVVVTSGGKHSLFVVLHAIAKPGDTILTEELSWPGIRSVAKYLDLRLEPVKLDDDGLVPDDLERACREHKPKALLCTPTAQNPTVSILPSARRRRIAEIARSNDIAIIEDEVYGPLIDEPPPPVATFAPERTFYLTSLSKVSAPGLRVGFVLAPQGQVGRVAQGVGATTIFTPPLMVEIGEIGRAHV